MTQVTIGGEPRTLGDFSAFKAIFAMEIVTEVEGAWRQVLTEGARFKREFEAENFVAMDRAEARRRYLPRPLYREIREETEDGRMALRDEPVLDAQGNPVLGPDPLGHLTEEDWQASGQKLRIADSPGEQLQIAAMIPVAFRHARVHVFRLLALTLTPNRELEEWDGEKDIATELDRISRELQHRAKADEIVRLGVAVVALCKEQLAGPFEEAAAAFRTVFQKETPPATTEPEPMRIEDEADAPSDEPPTSSTESLADTDGRPTSSSTEPASVSSSSSATA